MIRSRLILTSLLIIIVIIVSSLALWLQSLKEEQRYLMVLPDGSQVVRVVSGEDAVKTIRAIHWRPSAIDIEGALILVYSSGARLWIAKTNDACMEVEFMVKKISLYGDMLPYTAPSQHNFNGIIVYICMDKRNGWINAFWCKRDLVVWAELPPSEARYLKLLVKGIN